MVVPKELALKGGKMDDETSGSQDDDMQPSFGEIGADPLPYAGPSHVDSRIVRASMLWTEWRPEVCVGDVR